MAGKVIPLSDSFPSRKPDQVTTYDLLATSTIGYRTNPDRLVAQRGLPIYSRMAEDEQVKAVLVFKRDAITARGWQFKFRDGTALSETAQEQRKRVFTEVIARMRGSFADALNAIMTGRAYGFSITEKIYGEIEVDGKTWIGINQLMGRDPLSFRFYTDEYGVLTKIEQQTHHSGVVKVDPRTVIHYVHAPEWDHIYGRSDLREAYRSWYIKDQISNLWPLYLERFAGGFLHASQPVESNLSDRDTDELRDALGRAKSLGYILTPAGITLNIHQPPPTDAYEKAISFHDLAIAKALLVPNLLGISQASGGSYAQSQTQLEAFYWTLNADAMRLESCLNEQLFRDLGDQSWGDGEYPEFCFKPASIEHTKWMVQTWRDLLATKAAVPTEEDEAFLRKLLEMPPRNEQSTVLESPSEREQAAAQPEEVETEKPTPVGKGELREFARELFAAWDESQHPRDKDGKFDDGGGGTVKVDSWYDKAAKSYVVASLDADGNQVGEATYVGSKIEATMDRVLRERDIAFDPAQLTGSELTREQERLSKVSSLITEHLISQGRGNERPSETEQKQDVTSLAATAVWARQAALRREVQQRAGPGHNTLPRGIGRKARHTARAFITFESDAERDAWLACLKPRDEIELGARLAFDETDDDAAPTTPYAELSVALREDVLELPLRTRLTVQRVAGQRVEVAYRGD